MDSKTFGFGLAFASTLALGLLIGYLLKPSVTVKVYDQADAVPRSTELLESAYGPKATRIAKSNADAAEILDGLKRMTPLVKAGPFQISLNRTTGDFVILDVSTGQPLLSQKTEGARRTVSFLGEGQTVIAFFTYETDSHSLVDISVSRFGRGGIANPIRCYGDNNGNGLFDTMTDYEAGIVYRQKDLQWVEWRRLPGRADEKGRDRNGDAASL